MIAFTVLLILVGLRVLAAAFIGFLVIRPVRDCPACFRDTVPIRVRWLRLVAPWLEWRWCASCGWQGPARKIRDRSASHVPAAPPHAARSSSKKN